MSAGNRKLKIELHQKDPHCHWCKRLTILTDESDHHKGLPLNAATIDHLVSRLNVHRWVKKKAGQRRKVLACYECNQRRNIQETLCLSRSEILKRSQGFSLSPRGNPKIIHPLPTVREVLKQLKA